jgi:hypothetical protein
MDNHCDPLRHQYIFDPINFGNQPITVIGAGATGSRIALSLAKLGVQNLTVYDFDIVESHNIANQAYGNNDIGKPKVQALAELIKLQTGLVINAMNERVTPLTVISGYVFLLVDSMETRKTLWDDIIKFKFNIPYMIETRMGIDQGRVYTINPTDVDNTDFWEKSWYPDGEAELSPCGSTISVGPTAELVSGFAVWQFINAYNYLNKPNKPKPVAELVFGTAFPTILVTK